MSVSIYAIGYTALRDPEVFLGDLLRRSPGRYAGSPLGELEVAEHRERLAELMRQRRPWRDARLRLDDLAALAGLPPYQLSQVINQGFGEHFIDFVNRHRVEGARRRLGDPGRRSEPLLSLAFEAGFNNKTSFNEAFKKFTGRTPSAYRARVDDPVAG
jgi:AraC-like DNA-binding protein